MNVFFEGLNSHWNVDLFDAAGRRVPHKTFKTPTGVVVSFRPSKENYLDGQIGNYFFVFDAGPKAKLGVNYEIKTHLEISKLRYAPRRP